ncbi:putative ATP-binding protein [Bacteroides sp. 3_1_23]|uniref:ATP-binding protein n=1 Tax=Bacteroides sp. 3_1_23 TaxID=457390 RepID=UPI0001DAA70E|nr:ATP-binding protein [Bacteroides sp. 3_1_23]EFI38244.1 putative ATP-binding protein [Bacteroides sp. 3_1_23]
MEKRIIKAIIAERQQEIGKIQLVERPIYFEEQANYVLVGIRRAGKSYQMYQDIQNLVRSGKATLEDCLYINFEDERISSIEASELGLLLECYAEMYDNRKPLVYLDEIQNIEGWEKFARRLADSKYRVFITGSNARMLSRDIATTLGGRYIIREVFPFSFAEYLTFHQIHLKTNWEFDPEQRLEVIKLFNTYFHFGGFAEMFSLTDKREWINSLYQKILLGDIIARNEIRNSGAIRLLAKKLAESVMQPTTQTRLLHIVKSSGSGISRNTLADYLTYMNDVYLTFNIPNFTDSVAERMSSCKRYFYDNGLLGNFLINAETKLLENIVAINLIERYGKEEDRVFFYHKGVEVDFYIPDEEMAIQVSYSIDDPLTREREIRALCKMSEVFGIKKAFVITWDEERTVSADELDIEVVPVWKWLLR